MKDLARWAALAASWLTAACTVAGPPMTASMSTPTPTPASTPQRPAAQVAATLHCVLQPDGAGWAGRCEVPCAVDALAVNFDGLDARRACAGPARSVAATLARTAEDGRWLGTMEGVKPEDPTRFEVVTDRDGRGRVARTPFGWFAVATLQAVPAAPLSLRLDTSRQVRPTADDLAIFDRAIALLPSPARWNKNDDRRCPPGQDRLSLFCAMMQATTEVSGGVHYRQPAMQALREELNAVDASRINTHRIMDYNNHPATTLDEVHALLRRARERVVREVRAPR